MKLDLKEWIAKVTEATRKNEIRVGSAISLGTITINSNGFYGFNYPSIPAGSVLIGYRLSYSTNTGAFSVPAYNGGTQYVVGTPNARVTNLVLYPIYVMGGVVRSLLKALKPLTLGRGWAV